MSLVQMEEEVEGMEEGAGDKRWTLRIPRLILLLLEKQSHEGKRDLCDNASTIGCRALSCACMEVKDGRGCEASSCSRLRPLLCDQATTALSSGGSIFISSIS